MVSSIFGSVLKSTIISVDHEKNSATIKVDKVNVGMSGFVVQKFTDEHASILKNVIVESFDPQSKVATLKLLKYNDLKHSALPRGEWDVKVGDLVVLAFGYTRAVLIAPNEEIYHKITRHTNSVQWIHPDIFVSILSMEGHPTPLKKDFEKMSMTSGVGLFFFYLEQKLFTVDARSFKVLNISDVDLTQKSVKLPFFSRIDEIDSFWFGEGSSELESYEPHYYSLMIEHNPHNKELKELMKKFLEKDEE